MVSDRFPVANFSVNSQIQSQILSDLAIDLRSVLDASLGAENMYGPGIHRAYGLFWLWVLGAYEVVRVFSANKESFPERLNEQIGAVKVEIAELRMPFAKQELRGSGIAITREAFVEGYSEQRKDIAFVVKRRVYWARDTILRFESLLASIGSPDVLAPIKRRES